MATHEQLNRTAIVRDILAKVGALQEVPAEGWHRRTMEIIGQKGIKMHPQTVYGVRARVLKNRKKMSEKDSQQQAYSGYENEEQEQKKPNSDAVDFLELKVAELLALNEFANNFGGYERVGQALKALEALNHRE